MILKKVGNKYKIIWEDIDAKFDILVNEYLKSNQWFMVKNNARKSIQ